MVTKEQLFHFLDTAGKATYAGDGKEVASLRPGFRELVYEEGDFSYRDSYAGHVRSRGMEVVYYKGKPFWSSLYGGGMTKGNEHMADETFTFLKKAIQTDEEGFDSLRGPHNIKDVDWEYRYTQEGDIFEFTGDEQIYFQGNLVFFHKIIGGMIEN